MNVKTSAWRFQDSFTQSQSISPQDNYSWQRENSNPAVEKPYQYHLKQISS